MFIYGPPVFDMFNDILLNEKRYSSFRSIDFIYTTIYRMRPGKCTFSNKQYSTILGFKIVLLVDISRLESVSV